MKITRFGSCISSAFLLLAITPAMAYTEKNSTVVEDMTAADSIIIAPSEGNGILAADNEIVITTTSSNGGFIRPVNGTDSAVAIDIYSGSETSDAIWVESTGSVTIQAPNFAESWVSLSGRYGIVCMLGGNVTVKNNLYSNGGINVGGADPVEGATSAISLEKDAVIEANQSNGLCADQAGAVINVGGVVTVSTTGSNNIGIIARQGGVISLSSQVNVTASDASGIMADGGIVNLSAGANVNAPMQGGVHAIIAGNQGEVRGNAGRYSLTGSVVSITDGKVDLVMTSESRFTGFTNMLTGGTINLTLNDGSHWEVTKYFADDRMTSNLTSLVVDGTSSLTFAEFEGGFTNINAASVSLEKGTILYLGAGSDYFAGLESDLELTLFTATSFSDNGAILVADDRYILDYTVNGDGSYTVHGVTNVLIPEPSVAMCGLLGLGMLVFRRRKIS